MIVVHEAEGLFAHCPPVPIVEREASSAPVSRLADKDSERQPAANLQIHEAYDGECVRLRLTGALDLGSAPLLRRRLARLHAEKRLVRLDLSGLAFMDSSGIHLLVGAFSDAREDGSQLAIDSALSPQVCRLFKLAGLDRVIPGCGVSAPVAHLGRPTAAGNLRQRTAFDRALELLELRRAAEAYAARHGEPGGATYRAAWLRFRQQIRSIEDLQRMRRSSARPKSTRPKTPTSPADRGIHLPTRAGTRRGKTGAARTAVSP